MILHTNATPTTRQDPMPTTSSLGVTPPAAPSSATPARAVGLHRRLSLLALLGLLALLAFPPLARAVLPIEHWTTPSGARVFFVHAPSIPMIDISVGFDAGNRHDPGGKSGLSSLTVALLAKGIPGAGEAEIAEGFAKVGAQRGARSGDDRASVSLRSLTSPAELDRAVALLERVIAAPTFPEAIVAREKERVIQSLRESLARPDAIARRTFEQLLYPGHPYGVSPTPESVAAISREDLVAFHQAHFPASRAVVAMIGAVPRAQAEAIAARLTANLPPGAVRPEMPAVAPLARAEERRVEHPATQSHILIGTPAIAWGDPDQFALTVGNHVLGGGGFVSRLYSRVREQRGLAYSVYSYFSPALQPGPFTIGLQTRREQTDLALKVVRETLEEFLVQGPTDAEVEAAKANLIGGFALRIDSNAKILGYLSAIGAYGLPLDYLDRWTDRIAQVDARQIREAFARHVRADRLVTVVVGAGDSR
ncbi:MAG: hypothetical protein RIS35_2349 [Pseudomonadota bacterium]|jgi:zinc protease